MAFLAFFMTTANVDPDDIKKVTLSSIKDAEKN